MKLYKRDYTKLTAKEIKEWQADEMLVKKHKEGSFLNGEIFLKLKFPKASEHFKSLFPNNFLDPSELRNEKRLHYLLDKFVKLLDNKKTTERKLLNFISKEEAYFIIGSILDHYSFGHHKAFLFREFAIPPSYKSDFLIVGKSSMGYEFIFVELENPYSNVTLSDGSFGATFRKGYKQVEDWEQLLATNFNSMKFIFDKFKGSLKELPREFIDYDYTRFHYVIIAGRRTDFNHRTYRNKRRERGKQILILHYDNLVDTARRIIGNKTY